MMKKFITKTILIVLLTVGITACSDSYFDVNVPSSTATEEEVRMNDLLGPIIHSTMEAQRSGELTFGNYVQNFVSQGGVASGETTAFALWNQVYLFILPNIKIIKKKAVEESAPHFNAVADILTAINIGIATDTWDNIPFSQASLGQENFSPAFDTQEQIYTEIFALLDSAIAELQAPDNSDTTIGSGDLIYGGDINKWLRAAYTLKARYQLHLVNKGLTSANDVLASIANGFTSTGDDFQMFYDERNINPWYSQEILARNTGNFHNDLASQLVSSMNGDFYPFQERNTDTIITNTIIPIDPINNDSLFIRTVDPRLPLFMDNDLDFENVLGGDIKGFVSGGGGLAPDGTDANARFVENGFYTSIGSPLLLISYAEALFIKAEAAFLANGGTTTSIGSTTESYAAYIEGINASMDMYGVGANSVLYLAEPSVAVGETGLMLNHIMKEKYIHNFLNPETFVDFRRYDFSDDVFKGLTIREEEDSDGDFAGEWFRRASYPSSELNRNGSNVEANQQTPVTPVWWDQ